MGTSANFDFIVALSSLSKWLEHSKNYCPYGETCCADADANKEAAAFRVMKDGLLSDDAGPWVCLFYLAENGAVRQVEIARRLGVRRQLVARWLSRALEIAPGMRAQIESALRNANESGRVRRKKKEVGGFEDLELPPDGEEVEEVEE